MEGRGRVALMAIVAGRRDMPLRGMESAEGKQEKGKENRMVRACNSDYRMSLWKRFGTREDTLQHGPNLRALKPRSSQLHRGYHKHQNQKPASETFFRVRINEFLALFTECRWNWDILDFK